MISRNRQGDRQGLSQEAFLGIELLDLHPQL